MSRSDTGNESENILEEQSVLTVLFPTEQFVVVIVGLQTNDVHYEVDVEMPTNRKERAICWQYTNKQQKKNRDMEKKGRKKQTKTDQKIFYQSTTLYFHISPTVFLSAARSPSSF